MKLSRDQIQLLYSFNELNDTHKKFILNKTIGLTGKKYNKNQKCNIFADFNECQHYQIKYGGRIHHMINVDELNKSTLLYVHILEDKKELNECFKPIFWFYLWYDVIQIISHL